MKSQVALPFWLHEIDPEEYLFTLWRTVKDGNTTPGRIREFPRLCTVDMCRFRYIINVNNAPYYGQLWFISVQTCDQCQTVVNVTHWSSKQPSVPVFPHHQVWLERLIINGCEKRSEKLNGPPGFPPRSSWLLCQRRSFCCRGSDYQPPDIPVGRSCWESWQITRRMKWKIACVDWLQAKPQESFF